MIFRFVIPALAVAEATYLMARRGGPAIEAAFLGGLASYDVEPPATQDWPRIAELVERYADFPLGGTDASVLALAERLETTVVVTLDRRHPGALSGRATRTHWSCCRPERTRCRTAGAR